MQCAASSADIQSEDDPGGEVECEEDPLNWQSVVSRDVLANLTPQEIKRQEVINGESPTKEGHNVKWPYKHAGCPCSSELFHTERTHLRRLKVLDGVFYQRLSKDGVLPPEDIKNIFINLEEIIQLHGTLTARRHVCSFYT